MELFYNICNDINEHAALVIVMMVIVCALFEYSNNTCVYVRVNMKARY